MKIKHIYIFRIPILVTIFLILMRLQRTKCLHHTPLFTAKSKKSLTKLQIKKSAKALKHVFFPFSVHATFRPSLSAGVVRRRLSILL